MIRSRAFVHVALAALGIASAMACTVTTDHRHDTTQIPSVTGTITYRERIALPIGAVVKVQLVDVSRADAPAMVVGEQVFEVDGRQPPYAFEISYDAATLDERMTYAVQARIEEGGQLRFISDQHYPVITRGAPTRVDLLLKSVATHAP